MTALLLMKFFVILLFEYSFYNHLKRDLIWISYCMRKEKDCRLFFIEDLSMDSCMLISILDVTESDPQSRFSKLSRINIGSADIPLFSGRAVIIMSCKATRTHSYSASLYQDTSLSSTTQPLYAVRETSDRTSVAGN